MVLSVLFCFLRKVLRCLICVVLCGYLLSRKFCVVLFCDRWLCMILLVSLLGIRLFLLRMVVICWLSGVFFLMFVWKMLLVEIIGML